MKRDLHQEREFSRIAEAIQRESRRQNEHDRLEHRSYDLTTMPYGDYLQTPEWKKARKSAITRAAGRCQLCNSRPGRGHPLHVHHRTYARRGSELPEDLTVLCATCHDRFHLADSG